MIKSVDIVKAISQTEETLYICNDLRSRDKGKHTEPLSANAIVIIERQATARLQSLKLLLEALEEARRSREAGRRENAG